MRDRERYLSWLARPKINSKGGYAKVSDADLEELEELVQTLIETRWGRDPDGDLPIEFTLVNRTTHERLQYFPVPYGAFGAGVRANATPDQTIADCGALEIQILNFEIASGELRSLPALVRHVGRLAEANRESKTSVGKNRLDRG
jgi:hypothetical protein